MGFEKEAAYVLDRVREAVRGVLQASPVGIGRAVDLHRELNIDASLGWQIFRLATAEDALTAVSFVPSAGPMSKFLRAARQRGFAASALDQAQSAYAAFDAFVTEHADSRKAFDTMVTSLQGDGAAGLDLRQRRNTFRANSLLWGVQARTLYRCCIHFDHEGDHCKVATIVGTLGLHQLRRGSELQLTRRPIFRYPDEVREMPNTSVLLEEFCSTPLPSIRVVEKEYTLHKFISLDGIGLSSQVDCFFADLAHDVEVAAPGYTHQHVDTMVNMPCEELVLDMLLPHGWSDPAGATGMIFGSVTSTDQALLRSPEHLMPMKPDVVVSTSIDSLHDASMPRCPEMIRHVLRSAGATKQAFDVYRCRVQFPILHTVVSVDVPDNPRS